MIRTEAAQRAAPAPPASERVVDGACLGFAVWTLASHVVVALEGTLRDLLAVVATLAALGIGLALRGRRARARAAAARQPAGRADAPRAAAPVSGDPSREAVPPRVAGAPAPEGRRRLSWLLQPALAAVGGSALVAWRGDPVALWWTAVAVLAVAAALLAPRAAPRAVPPARGVRVEAILWGIAVAGAALALVAHREDLDDAFYVNVAVAAADAPGAPLLRDDTLHGVEGLPIHHPAYRLHSLELLAGAISWATGIPAIAVFHLGFAAAGALLVPLAYARLFRLLTPARWIGSVAALLLVLAAAGDAHRWYGNFAFVRMWQGKAFLLCVFLPLVQAAALEFGLAPSRRSWLRLCAAQVASLGASSSAVWAAPAAATIALCCVLPCGRRGLRTLALGGLASLYVLGAGLALRHALDREAAERAGQRRPALAEEAGREAERAHRPGVQLSESLTLVLGEGRLRAATVAASVLGWAVLAPGLAQRFAILGPLLVALLLEPHATRWVAANVTGASYWRLLWVAPAPVLLALVIAAPLQLGGSRSLRLLGQVGCLALGAAFALGVPVRSSLAEANGVRLGWPGLKVPRGPYRWASVLARSVPPGSHVVAPLSVSSWVPTFPGRAYPLVVRGAYLRRFRGQLGEQDLLDRTVASRYAGGELPRRDADAVFARSLERYAVKAVCLRESAHAEQARQLLRRAGFRRALQGLDLEIWVRP